MSEAAAAPPARWLLLVTIGLVALFTVLRLWLAATLDFRSDEAYYWTWSHQAVLSFLDHPPMVAWFERFGQLFFGDTTLGARFGQIVALPLIELLLADIARRRTGNWNAALLVVLALECSTYYAVVVTTLEPSIPLLLFTSLMLWALCRLDESMDGRWWLLAGLAAGLALLSKYLVVLLAPALLVFLLLTPTHRRWLGTPWPWLALLIAAVTFSPVIVWNARHDWISFAFQSVRLGEGQSFGLAHLFYFLLLDTVGVGLVLSLAAIVGSIVLLVRAVRQGQALEAAIATAFLFPLAFFAARSLTFQINMSWAYFIWPLGVLALVLSMKWNAWPRRRSALLAGIAITGVPLSLALFFHALVDTNVWLNGYGDPIGMDAGYGEMSKTVLAEARGTGATWIATTDYRTYANLLWHIGKDIPVLQVNERARFLDFAPRDAADFAGRALYVRLGPATPLVAAARHGPATAIPIVWRGTTMARMTLETLDGFMPELEPPPGSAAWVWAPQ